MAFLSSQHTDLGRQQPMWVWKPGELIYIRAFQTKLWQILYVVHPGFVIDIKKVSLNSLSPTVPKTANQITGMTKVNNMNKTCLIPYLEYFGSKCGIERVATRVGAPKVVGELFEYLILDRILVWSREQTNYFNCGRFFSLRDNSSIIERWEILYTVKFRYSSITNYHTKYLPNSNILIHWRRLPTFMCYRIQRLLYRTNLFNPV